MKNKVIKAVNNQLNNELASAYLYLAMSADAENKSLKGFANWFAIQAREEMDHAMGLYKHLIERGTKVSLVALATPQGSYKDITAAITETLKHEQYITTMIHSLYDLALEEKDHALVSFLQWYIDEQVEEEDHATELLDKVKMVANNSGALYMLDQELLSRQYVPASVLTQAT